MEYAAKARESKAEETAEQQREASARCQIELLSATSKYVEMNDVVDRTCTSSTTAETCPWQKNRAKPTWRKTVIYVSC